MGKNELLKTLGAVQWCMTPESESIPEWFYFIARMGIGIGSQEYQNGIGIGIGIKDTGFESEFGWIQ